MKRLAKSSKKGFTLIEMMLVVAILVILTSIAALNVTDALNAGKANQSVQEEKFNSHLQSQNNYVRTSLLSQTPYFPG